MKSWRRVTSILQRLRGRSPIGRRDGLPRGGTKDLIAIPEAPDGVGWFTSSFSHVTPTLNWAVYAGAFRDPQAASEPNPSRPLVFFIQEQRVQWKSTEKDIDVPRASGPLTIVQTFPWRVVMDTQPVESSFFMFARCE